MARAVTSIEKPGKSDVKDDAWLHTFCDLCFSHCPAVVHRVNGVAVKIEGDKTGPYGNGQLCAKGFSGLMSLYDPNRLTRPLKRTNPEKGIGVDPKWQEISWDEALDLIAENLKRVREDDPRKLVLATFDLAGMALIQRIWGPAFGTFNTAWQGYYCGNSLHNAIYLTNGTFSSEFDIDNCNYVILQGTQSGFMAGMPANLQAQRMADARVRGLRVVVVDPIMTNAAGKADEWIPIRPGTDGAWLLGLINVLVNELGVYDVDFVKRRTNSPYLVRPDGHYAKDGEKPLVWDMIDEMPKAYDAEVKDYGLEGSFEVDGVECRPAFDIFKENVSKYTPEMVSEITTIPAETVRRVAREFGEAARIGETLEIDGHTIPHRPVAVSTYKGVGQHKYGTAQLLALQVLQMLMGNYYAVGGHVGLNLVGPGESWWPRMSSDGMIIPATAIGEGADYYNFEVERPQTLGLQDLLPISTNRAAMVQQNIMNPERFKFPYTPDMLMFGRRSLMQNNATPKASEETLKKFKFIVYFALHLDEQAELADVVLPEQHYLEKLEARFDPGAADVHPLTDYYFWRVRRPVVKPMGEARNWLEVLLELADRAGFLDEVYRLMNLTYNLKKPYRLDPKQRYTLEEIYDRQAKSILGPDIGIEWFKEHGYYKVKRSTVEKYPAPYIKPRFPVYFENILRAGKEVKRVAEEIDLEWDTSDYEATINWRPCPAFSREARNDFYAVNYRLPTHNGTYTAQVSWLNELAERHVNGYNILMNLRVARERGIEDGDTIRLESRAGSVSGKVRLTEGIHPEVLGIPGAFGGWAEGRPLAKGKSVSWNTLMPIDMEQTSPISGGLDSCVRVTVTKER